MKKLFLLSFCSMMLFACAKKNIPAATASTPAIKTNTPSTPTIEISNQTQPAVETAEEETKKNNMILVENGRKVFESNCNKCHELKLPGNYTQLRWVKLVEWMAPKARLTEQEKKQCLAYLQYNAKDATRN